MLFNSGQFLFFFGGIYLLYLLLNHRWQNRLLLLASYGFYGAWDWRYLALILISTLIDFLAARAMSAARQAGQAGRAKRWMLVSLCGNLGMLGFFKYYNFFAQSLVDLGQALGASVSSVTLDIVLPVGISFYTFQTLSYSIDVYRGRQKPVESLPDFALYVAFFPQLVAGPIERARRLLPQLQRPRRVAWEDVGEGAWMVLWGLFKKVFIADNLAPYVSWAFAREGALTAGDIYLAAFAFAIQIYCDFSGYSDMARGLAQMLGVNLSRNFKLPFWASNPAELWQRWHITLSNWFRDYVYGPLRNNFFTPSTQALALIPTLTLVGLWHGAAWKYVLFGLFWGVALYLFRLLQPTIARVKRFVPRCESLIRAAGMLFTFHLWMLFSLFFIAVDAWHGWRLWGQLLVGGGGWALTDPRDLLSVFLYSSPLILMQSVQLYQGRQDVVEQQPAFIRVPIYILILLLLLVQGSEYRNEFIYFQF